MPPNRAGCNARQRVALESWRATTPAARRLRGSLSGSVSAGAMPGNALVDTGAILAILDRTDRWHQVCVEAFRQLRLPLLTSEAVLTELFHLVGDSRADMEAAWKFAGSGALVLAPIEDAELPHLRSLMSRCWDVPWISPIPLSYTWQNGNP